MLWPCKHYKGGFLKNIHICRGSDSCLQMFQKWYKQKDQAKGCRERKKMTSLTCFKELLINALLRSLYFTLVKGLLFLLNSRHANKALKILLDTFFWNTLHMINCIVHIIANYLYWRRSSLIIVYLGDTGSCFYILYGNQKSVNTLYHHVFEMIIVGNCLMREAVETVGGGASLASTTDCGTRSPPVGVDPLEAEDLPLIVWKNVKIAQTGN